MKPDAITWAVMLGLVSSVSVMGCGKSGTNDPIGTTGNSTRSYPVGHPCYGKGNCAFYLLLPDGGAAPAPASTTEEGSDAGKTTICGPCNG